MNKGLDLIQRQQIEVISGYPTGNVYIGLTSEELAELEKELKALEIIKRLPTDYLQDLLMFIRDDWFKEDDFGAFISWCGDEIPILINEEEYDVLREVF